MPRLTATADQLIRILERQGWRRDHVRGSHYYYRHATKPGLVTVPYHKGRSLKPKTLRSILDVAGINREQFFKLR